jgi:centrosomal protein CEP76
MNRQTSHKRFHSIISGMQGTVDDHCHLLCSLLLGFGLKAYVCIGYSYKGEHSWVISEDAKSGSIVFW